MYIAINKSCARKEILFCLASIACSACQKRVGENVISAFIQPFVLPQRHWNHPDHLSQIGENVPSQVCVVSSETGHLPNVWAAGRVGHSVGRGSLDGTPGSTCQGVLEQDTGPARDEYMAPCTRHDCGHRCLNGNGKLCVALSVVEYNRKVLKGLLQETQSLA